MTGAYGSAAPETDTNVFDLTRRGYDRDQVDSHVQSLLQQLDEAERARQREEGRANRSEAELGAARDRLREQAQAHTERLALPDADGQSDATSSGFGYRVEKLMRAAEQEAAETRQSATREASALLEQAREDAEAHRHEVEQSLIARAAEVDQTTAQRKVELDERQRQIDAQAQAAQEEAERLLSEARHNAEQIEARARSTAEDHRAEVDRAIRERQAEAEKELSRLRELHHGVRSDLGRLLQSLASEFDGQTPPGTTDPPGRRQTPAAADEPGDAAAANPSDADASTDRHQHDHRDEGDDGQSSPGDPAQDQSRSPGRSSPGRSSPGRSSQSRSSQSDSSWFAPARPLPNESNESNEAGRPSPPGPSHLSRTRRDQVGDREPGAGQTGDHGSDDGGSGSEWFATPGPSSDAAAESVPPAPGPQRDSA